jgi:hypothetical protein
MAAITRAKYLIRIIAPPRWIDASLIDPSEQNVQLFFPSFEASPVHSQILNTGRYLGGRGDKWEG